MNFGGDRLYFKRVPYSPRQGELATVGKWSELQQECPKLMKSVKTACQNILSQHGLGYSKNTFEKLLMCELEYLGNDTQNPVVNLIYGDLELGERVADCLVADSRLVMKTSALPENTSSTDLARLQSCMAHMDIPCGMLINCGKTALHLRAVYPN
jgi:GxxExxY protein